MPRLPNILLVDDDFASLRILQAALRKNNLDIFTASSGKAALAVIDTSPIDILITDIRMPIMNGLQLIEKVRQTTPNMIFIVVSASDDIKLCIEAMKLGAINYILKPVNQQEFQHTLQNAIDKFNLFEHIKQKQYELEEKNRQLTNEIANRKRIDTNLQLTEKELQVSKDMLQLAIDGAELGIWKLDLEDMTFTLSEKWNELLERKFTRDVVEYDSLHQLVHPDDKLLSFDEINQADGEHNFYERRLRLKTGSGCWKWVLTRGKIVKWDSNGIPLQAAGTIQDHTFVKNIEDALLETQHRLNTILNNMHEIIFYMNADKRILWVNKTACQVAGRAEREIIGQNCHDILFQNCLTCTDCPLDQSPNNQKWEKIIRKSDKAYHMHIYPIKNRNHEITAYIEVGLDITEQEKAKDEARRRTEQLFQADKMVSLGILVSGVAHEINNPNNYMMLNIALIRQVWEELCPHFEEFALEQNLNAASMNWQELQSEMPTLINGIEEGSDRIKEIVRELKDYAREVPADMSSEVKIDDVIKSALILCESLIKRSTKYFNYNCAESIPAFRGDSQRIEQVIINLLQNACQALKQRDKHITINTFHNPSEQAVIIEVIDEGCGISERNLKRIKDPFFTTKRETGGTGLGISISDTIVTEHGGNLVFASQQGEGTTATVTFPIRS